MESNSFLILIRASRTMGPHLWQKTNSVNLCNFPQPHCFISSTNSEALKRTFISDTIKYALCFASPRHQDKDRLISSVTHPPRHTGSPRGQSGPGATYFADAHEIGSAGEGSASTAGNNVRLYPFSPLKSGFDKSACPH